MKDQHVSLSGYKIYRNDRDTNAGGVALYVKEDYVPEPIVRIKSNVLELLVLGFTPEFGKPFFVVCWYRPPTSADEVAFKKPKRDFERTGQGRKGDNSSW